MTAPSPTEQATIARFEAAADAEESLRERVARAIAQTEYTSEIDPDAWIYAFDEWQRDSFRDYADAAIAVMRPARATALTATPNHGRNAT